MHKAVTLFLAFFCAVMIGGNAAAAPSSHADANANAKASKLVNFAAPAQTLQLQGALSSYHAPGGEEVDGSRWYILSVSNTSPEPATRILLVRESAETALRIFPRSTRAMLLQLASSDSGVVIERAPAFRRDAYRVTLPAKATAALALRVSNSDDPPSLLAWREPALVAYSHQLAIFIAAVAGLIAAAAAITGGVAAMTGHAAPRWAGLTLLGVLVVWLVDIGLFDRGWSTMLGGPYGLLALFEGLALAAAVRLTDVVAPFSDLWPLAGRYRRWGLAGLVGLAFLALIGVPAAALMVQVAVVVTVAALAAYLVRRGVAGSRAARVLAPGATVFALVTLAAALVVIAGVHDNPIAAQIVGGFAAAGAVLISLAVGAGEGLGLFGPRPFSAVAGAAAAPVATASKPQAPAPAGDETTRAALTAIGASHQGVYDLDFATDTLHLSAEAAALIGLTNGAQSLAHDLWIGRVHAEDRGVYKDAILSYRGHPGLAFRIEFRVKSESGRYPWFELRATMEGGTDFAERCIGLMADVTTRKEAEAAAFNDTMRDPLTGLGNRVALMDDLEGLNRHAADSVFAVLDIDRFKAIHASLGDAGADAVLKHIAERLGTRFGHAAHTYRIGGDSFALLFGEDAGGVNTIGAELIELCGAPLIENGRKIFAPVSVGLAAGRDAGEPLDLLRNAELALRQAKRQGGGAMRVYSHDLEGASPYDAVALEAELRRALDEGQLDVFYQPIVRLSDRTIAGFEALLRWHHPERGLVWPADFIGHAEETGFIIELGKFALSRATDDLARWQHHFPLDPPLFVSVNVSRRQLQDGAFEAHLARVVAHCSIVPGSLCLEITESAIAASEQAGERLARLRELGVCLAIDDFGTGLSSLSQLKSVPFDSVKIDRSFLARQGSEDGQADVLLNSVVSLAHDMKRGVVVEGVESEEDAQRLVAMGCEFAQGFYFSVPLPAREALNYIALHYDASAVAGPAPSGGSDASGAPGIGGQT